MASLAVAVSTPISATGATEKEGRVATMHPARGFTLIELLVVVVIIAVLAGALALAVGVATGPLVAEREARRMERLLGLACERAVLSGRDYGLVIHAHGYRFAVRQAEGWMSFAACADAVFAPRELPEGLALHLDRDGRTVAIPEEPPQLPQLGCVASGEMTPFTLQFEHGVDPRWRLVGQFDGTLRVEPEDA
ncbi:MAG TPA: type II secretion system minor pseudopilin GspH [Xanthomonadaceae bacterium]|nr:type II secretion system minor pseudopilin GspH [Xanthomonadaceae bacterium]